MSESHPDIQSILAALAAQRPPASTQTPPAPQPGQYPPPSGSAQPQSYQAPPPGAGSYGNPGQGLPAPASSGNLDLSAIRPVNSGTMNFDDIISKARAHAAEKGIASYDRPLVYNQDSRSNDRPYQPDPRSPGRGEYHDHSYRDDRRGGQGRDYGRSRDRSFSPPRGRHFSPRGGGSGGRERSPLRGGDDNSDIIQVESSLVGLIIGRQGENLRRIEAESTCRVQFLPANDGGSFRQCKITGPRHRRAEVKEAIDRIIEDSGMGPLNRTQEKPRETNRGGTATLREGEDHLQIMVPDRTVGLIIGRGGETIRDLQERSGCHINIVSESKSVNGLRPVNLIGTHEAAMRAKDSIMEIVDSDSRGEVPPGGRAGPAPRNDPPPRMQGGPGGPGGGGRGGSDKINDAIYVPSDAVGMIIGKGGETIREMQSTTGCKINVAQSSGPGEVEREIALIGSRDSIEQAKSAIEEKVDAVRQKNSGGGGPPGRGRHRDLDNPSYSDQAPQQSSTNPPSGDASGDANDPYAQYGGYQNYVALWYQSLMYQQQQQGGSGAAAGAPAPGA